MGEPDKNPNVIEPGSPNGVLGAITTARLVALRNWARAILIAHRLAWLAAGALAALLLGGVLDYFLRSPGWLRAIGLLFALSVLITFIVRSVWPAVRFKPSLEDLALRLERTNQGERAALPGVLASGAGFAQSQPDREVSRALAQGVTRAADERIGAVHPLRFLSLGRLVTAGAVAALALLSGSGLVLLAPTLSAIGAQRMLMPWTDALWPKRTQLTDVTAVRVHALGSSLTLRAGLVRSAGEAESSLVEAQYRMLIDGVPGPTKAVALALQREPVRVPPSTPDQSIDSPPVPLFEQILKPADLTTAAPAGTAPASPTTAKVELEYWLASGDDTTSPTRVRLVEPPSVVAGRATVTPPPYLPTPPRGVDLGAGVDESATLTGVLVGSKVDLQLDLNKPVPGPRAADDATVRAWLTESLGQPLADAVAPAGTPIVAGTITITPQRWSTSLVASSSLVIPVRIVDEFGIASGDTAVYRVSTLTDKAPEATITKPESDLDVLPTAQVAIVAEARDDVALTALAMQQTLARPGGPKGNPDSPGRTPEPTGPAIDLTTDTFAVTTTPRLAATLNHTLVPADQGAKPGDELWISAVATDAYLLNGQRHEPVRSPVRKVRIISAEQLLEQLWNDLTSVRRAVIRTAEQQQDLRNRTGTKPTDPKQEPGQLDQAARDQTAIDESLTSIGEAMQKVAERAQSNRLSNPELQAAIAKAQQVLREAKEPSTQAGQQIRQARDAAANQQPAESAKDRAAAQQSQEQTERKLVDLAQALDRGQDAWAVKRGLEQLIQDQQALQQETSKLGEQTAGKSPSQLTPSQRQQSDQNAQQQEQLAKKAEQLVQQLDKAAKQMRESDPPTASALQEAAKRAQRSNVAKQLEQAAQKIRENQQQAAADQQQKAEQTLQQMLSDIQQAAKQRDAVLRRELESLIESIKTLIARQQKAIEHLAAQPGVLATPLDAEMITLQTSTLDAAQRAASGGKETAPVAVPLKSAAAAQTEAITSLRAEPADSPAAKVAESTALTKLTEALEVAERALKQAEKRDQNEKRKELRRQYQELLDEQNLLVASTQELVGKDDRRARIAAVQLADRQTALRTKAKALLDDTQDLQQSAIFPRAHARLDDLASQSAQMLTDAKLEAGLVIRQQAASRTLAHLIQALADEPQPQDEFRQNEGGNQPGGGGQQQPQPLIPPITELKLLRQLQDEALTVTRQAADAADVALAEAAKADATALQNDLVQVAKKILEKLEQQDQPGGGGGGGVPKPIDPAKPQPPKPGDGAGEAVGVGGGS